MAEFYISLSNIAIANQVANLVNTYNRWYTKFTGTAIMMSPACYFVEIDRDKVVGCSSYLRENKSLSKIQHICTLPNYRGHGIAKKLTKIAMDNSKTEFIYMTIREDNLPSIALATSLGFKMISKVWFVDHWTLTFGWMEQQEGSRINGYASNR